MFTALTGQPVQSTSSGRCQHGAPVPGHCSRALSCRSGEGGKASVDLMMSSAHHHWLWAGYGPLPSVQTCRTGHTCTYPYQGCQHEPYSIASGSPLQDGYATPRDSRRPCVFRVRSPRPTARMLAATASSLARNRRAPSVPFASLELPAGS